MKLFSTIFLLFSLLFLASPCIAEGHGEMSGYWTSSSGASINVAYAGNPDDFVIVVNRETPNRIEYKAYWMEGFRIQFYYFSGNDKIYGVYDPDTEKIGLSNEEGTWSAEWHR